MWIVSENILSNRFNVSRKDHFFFRGELIKAAIIDFAFESGNHQFIVISRVEFIESDDMK